MFEVGEKVVCVDDSPGSVPSTSRVEKGKIYVVESTEKETPSTWAVVQLVGMDGDWFIHRFRKLTDIQAENKAKRQAKKGDSGRIGAKGFSHQDS